MDQYGVIGNPIAHSLSPQIHHLFAEQVKQKIIYRPILAALDQFAQTLADFQAQGGLGVNVTAPFKQQAFALMDSCSERAQRARAVNTIKLNADGSCFGDNTDGVGLVRDIVVNQHIVIRERRILILGAGGAVRGMLANIINESPAALIIANRTAHKAAELVTEFHDCNVLQAAALADLTDERFDLIINGTSADSFTLPPATHYYDLRYGSKIKPWLQQVAAQGMSVSDGFGMLVEQAAEAFYLWRGMKPQTQFVTRGLVIT